MTDEEFATLFPHMTDAELAERMGTTRSTVYCRARRLGLFKSPEQRARARKLAADKIRGERNYAWKGGVSTDPRVADERYRPWRDAVLKRDNYTCAECGDRRRRSEMHAHHIKPFADYVALRYDVSNGTTLCLICHHALHGRTVRPRIKIPCKCGCGTLIDAVDKWGLAREWVKGHSGRGKVISPEHRAAVGVANAKRPHTPMSEETKAKISATRTGRPATEADKAGHERRKARWSNKYEHCVLCGLTESRHYCHGLCLHCYCRQRTLRRNPDAPTRPHRHTQ